MSLTPLCLKRICFFLLLLFPVSCTWNLPLTKPDGEQEFSEEIFRWEKVAREDPDPPVRAQAHLKLAYLFLSHRNPRVNYSRALQEMKSCLFLAPGNMAADDLGDWLAVLRELERVRKEKKGIEENKKDLQIQIEKLRSSLKRIQAANQTLNEEVAGLQETLEKLKALDYQMEEERTLIR